MFRFHTPRKRHKNQGFATFSGGIEIAHWTKMGYRQGDHDDNSNQTILLLFEEITTRLLTQSL